MARPKTKKASNEQESRKQSRRMRARALEFKSARSEGGLIPGDLLAKVAARDADPELGLRDEDYNLLPGERLGERINEVWAKLVGIWERFQKEREKLGEGDRGDSITRNKWLTPLLTLLGYGKYVHYGVKYEADGRSFTIARTEGSPVALHFVGCGQELDRDDSERPDGRKASPHSYMQDFLNKNDDYLWGFVSNGLRFRILRDAASLSRAAYLEFDLEEIMTSNSFGDFALFYMVAHESRTATRAQSIEAEEEAPESDEESEEAEAPQVVDRECWLEKWRSYSIANGARALEEMAKDVVVAINAFGEGFLRNRHNKELREKLESGELSENEYYHSLLHLVYQCVFLLIAEDRGLLFAEGASPGVREFYDKYYSISRIRRLSRRNRGSEHGDLWRQLRRLLEWAREGNKTLGIPAFGSALFEERKPNLCAYELSSTALLKGMRALTHTTRNGVLQPVDYRNLGMEEIGGVYESLLELKPSFPRDANAKKRFVLEEHKGGNARKTSGSYYTPLDLTTSLLDTALEPTLDAALAGVKGLEARERVILNFKICDPSCGSGAFLVGAARRLGKRLAQERTGDDEPDPRKLREGIRDVVARCVYGVDLNPLAIELCKIALWIESLKEGTPLAFLDHHIKCGNSLVGAPLNLDDVAGVPDGAFESCEGDDKKVCSALKKRNAGERVSENRFEFGDYGNLSSRGDLYRDLQELLVENWRKLLVPTQSYAEQEENYAVLQRDPNFLKARACRDVWCAAFFVPKTDERGIYFDTSDYARCLEEGDGFLLASKKEAVKNLVAEYSIFHWSLEFPDVFPPEGKRGFDVVLGNPPWERVKLQEKEWFASRKTEIAEAKNKAARDKMIRALAESAPGTREASIYRDFQRAKRQAECVSLFLRKSERYPLCGVGDVNTYTVFAELNRTLVAKSGRVGCIVPSGIATDDSTKKFFQDLVEKDELRSLYDFENRKKIFPAVDSRMKFSLLTMGGAVGGARGARLSFFNRATSDLKEPDKIFTLAPEEIALVNPNTRTCPIFSSTKDALLTKAIYRRAPILIREATETEPERNPWNIRFLRMFDMSNDSHLFRERATLEEEGYVLRGARFVRDDGSEYYPLYEAKMIHHYNHRFGDYSDLPQGSKSTQLPDVPLERLQDPNYAVMPRYWVPKEEVMKKLPQGTKFLMGWRNICRVTDVRTVVAGFTAPAGFGNSYNCIVCKDVTQPGYFLYADLVSFVHDYAARQKLGGTNMNYFIFQQLLALAPERFSAPCPFVDVNLSNGGTYADFILPRVLELVYTSEDLRGFARSVGYEGAPFRWDDARRFRLRCELDALYFGLYFGFNEWRPADEAPESDAERAALLAAFPTPIDALDHVMGTFPIVRRKELEDDVKRAVAKEIAPDDNERYPSHAAIRAIFQRMAEDAGK